MTKKPRKATFMFHDSTNRLHLIETLVTVGVEHGPERDKFYVWNHVLAEAEAEIHQKHFADDAPYDPPTLVHILVADNGSVHVVAPRERREG